MRLGEDSLGEIPAHHDSPLQLIKFRYYGRQLIF